MLVNIANKVADRVRDSKMVIILGTALALGVVAACVVPWFYCKPTDGCDDDSEATAVRDDAGQSRSISHDNSIASRIEKPINALRRSVNIIKLTISDEWLSSSNATTLSTTTNAAETSRDPSRMHVVFSEKTNVRTGNLSSIQEDQDASAELEGSRKSESEASRNLNSENNTIEDVGENTNSLGNLEVEETGFLNPAQKDLKKDSESTVLEVQNSALMESKSNDSGTLTSESQNSEPSVGEFQSAESSNNPFENRSSSMTESQDASKSVEENSSANLATLVSSNPTDESTTETTCRTSQESVNSSCPSRVPTKETIKLLRNAEVLEPVDEISPYPTPWIKKRKSNEDIRGLNKIPEFRIDSEVSLASNSSRNLNHATPISAIPLGTTYSLRSTPASTQSAPCELFHKNTEYSGKEKGWKKTRLAMIWTKKFKNFLKGKKSDVSPQTRREEESTESRTESILSAVQQVPGGHSTLINGEQRFNEIIEPRRSISSGKESLNQVEGSIYLQPWMRSSMKEKHPVKFHPISETKDQHGIASGIMSSLENVKENEGIIGGSTSGIDLSASSGETLENPGTRDSKMNNLENSFEIKRSLEDERHADRRIPDINFINVESGSPECIQEEHLDLTTRSGTGSEERSTNSLSAIRRMRRRCSSSFSREVFPEVKGFFKNKKSSKSNEEVTSHSDSLEFSNDRFKSIFTDENQNFTSDSSNSFGKLRIENTPKNSKDDKNRLDFDYLKVNTYDVSKSYPAKRNDKAFPRKMKTIFKLHDGSKDREKLTPSGKKGKVLDSVNVEFQRNSTETCSKPEDCEFKEDQQSPGVPCTEL